MNLSLAPLGEVTDLLTDGTHYSPPNVGNGVPFLTVKDVSDAGLDFIGCSKISPSEFEVARKQNSAPTRGDVLFSKDGTVGKVHLVREDRDFAVLSSLAILRPSSCLDGGYLAHFLRTPSALDAASKKKTGSAIRRIVLRDLSTLEIPLPPLEEQRRIAVILDTVDALRRKHKCALDLIGTLIQSIFLKMFGDPAENKVHKVLVLGDIVRDIESGWSPTCLDRPANDREPGVLKLSSVTGTEFLAAENKALPPELSPKPGTEVVEGDILFCRKNTRELVGSSVYVWESRRGLYMSDLIFRLVPEQSRIDPLFLQTQISLSSQRRRISDMSGGAAGSMPNVSKSRLRELSVIVPEIKKQIAFATAARCQHGLLSANMRAAGQIEALFASLQHRAFSGQL